MFQQGGGFSLGSGYNLVKKSEFDSDASNQKKYPQIFNLFIYNDKNNKNINNLSFYELLNNKPIKVSDFNGGLYLYVTEKGLNHVNFYLVDTDDKDEIISKLKSVEYGEYDGLVHEAQQHSLSDLEAKKTQVKNTNLGLDKGNTETRLRQLDNYAGGRKRRRTNKRRMNKSKKSKCTKARRNNKTKGKARNVKRIKRTQRHRRNRH